ncbi:unnamed protein product, partial [Prorocentrum cordatum]
MVVALVRPAKWFGEGCRSSAFEFGRRLRDLVERCRWHAAEFPGSAPDVTFVALLDAPPPAQWQQAAVFDRVASVEQALGRLGRPAGPGAAGPRGSPEALLRGFGAEAP